MFQYSRPLKPVFLGWFNKQSDTSEWAYIDLLKLNQSSAKIAALQIFGIMRKCNLL